MCHNDAATEKIVFTYVNETKVFSSFPKLNSDISMSVKCDGRVSGSWAGVKTMSANCETVFQSDHLLAVRYRCCRQLDVRNNWKALQNSSATVEGEPAVLCRFHIFSKCLGLWRPCCCALRLCDVFDYCEWITLSVSDNVCGFFNLIFQNDELSFIVDF